MEGRVVGEVIGKSLISGNKLYWDDNRGYWRV